MPHATSEGVAASKQQIHPKKSASQPEAPQSRNVQSKNVKVGVWNLKSTEFTEIDIPENTEALFSIRGDEPAVGRADTGEADTDEALNEEAGTDETVIGADGRKKVSRKDFMPGGKYRSVVKLFLRYEGQGNNAKAAWAMGTGWLINQDTIVTAGHCSYDWGHKLGRLTHVKAYIGYAGKESIKDTSKFAVQFRTGKRVATTQRWLSGGDNESGDVSFIQVNKPFTAITPIKYQQTPLTGTKVMLGVVGFPGDLVNPKTKEQGAFMYDMYNATTFDIAKSKDKMLEYTIDTFAGNSGSPVFRQSDMASIGVHVLGGKTNSASVISGPFGNPFDAYVAALKGKSTGSHERAIVDSKPAPWLSWITVPSKASFSGGGSVETDGTSTEAPEETADDTEAAITSDQPTSDGKTEEGLFGFFSKALQVSGPLGMIAGVGMHAVGAILQRKKKEAAFDEAYSFDGVAERALLGEAALTTIVHFGGRKCQQLGIFDKMQAKVLKLQPVCRRAGPAIMPFVMEPAWRATTGGLRLPPKQTGEADVEPSRTPTADDMNTLGFGPRVSANKEAFIGLLTESLTMTDAEAFTGTEANIGKVISSGLRVAGPLLGSVLVSGLPLLLGGGSEADFEADVDADPEAAINDSSSSAYTYDAMTQRAIAGEAALEALMETPVETLQQEGWMDVLKKGLLDGRKYLEPGLGVLGGALGVASAAVSLAAANKQQKKETQAVAAGQDDGDGAETGDAGGDGEADVDEADVNGEADVDDEAAAETEFLAGLATEAGAQDDD